MAQVVEHVECWPLGQGFNPRLLWLQDASERSNTKAEMQMVSGYGDPPKDNNKNNNIRASTDVLKTEPVHSKHILRS